MKISLGNSITNPRAGRGAAAPVLLPLDGFEAQLYQAYSPSRRLLTAHTGNLVNIVDGGGGNATAFSYDPLTNKVDPAAISAYYTLNGAALVDTVYPQKAAGPSDTLYKDSSGWPTFQNAEMEFGSTYLLGGGTITLDNPSFFMVRCKPTSIGGTQAILSSGDNGFGTAQYLAGVSDESGQKRFVFRNYNGGVVTFSVQSWEVLTENQEYTFWFWWNGSGLNIAVDDGTEAVDGAADYSASSSGAVAALFENNFPNYQFNGTIIAIASFTSVLNQSQRTAIHNLLAA
jgi:hypothetical protein